MHPLQQQQYIFDSQIYIYLGALQDSFSMV